MSSPDPGAESPQWMPPLSDPRPENVNPPVDPTLPARTTRRTAVTQFAAVKTQNAEVFPTAIRRLTAAGMTLDFAARLARDFVVDGFHDVELDPAVTIYLDDSVADLIEEL